MADTLKTKSHHDANFAVTGSSAASDDKVGIMTTLNFQWMCLKSSISYTNFDSTCI